MSEGWGGPSIVGGWLGTFSYQNRHQLPVRFEATFRGGASTLTPGAFSGTILDDGPLGEATVGHGLQTGQHVHFTKTYLRPPERYSVGPVQYHGTLSDDGTTVTGTWELQVRRRGRVIRALGQWDARRLWSEEAAHEAISDAAGRELTATVGAR